MESMSAGLDLVKEGRVWTSSSINIKVVRGRDAGGVRGLFEQHSVCSLFFLSYIYIYSIQQMLLSRETFLSA